MRNSSGFGREVGLRSLVPTLAREHEEPQDMWSRSSYNTCPSIHPSSRLRLPRPTITPGSRPGRLHEATLPSPIAQPPAHGYARVETIDLHQDVGDLSTWSPKQTSVPPLMRWHPRHTVGQRRVPPRHPAASRGWRPSPRYHPIPRLHLAALPRAARCEPHQTPFWPAFTCLGCYTAVFLTSGHHGALPPFGLSLLPCDLGVSLRPRWTSGVVIISRPYTLTGPSTNTHHATATSAF